MYKMEIYEKLHKRQTETQKKYRHTHSQVSCILSTPTRRRSAYAYNIPVRLRKRALEDSNPRPFGP